MNTNTSDPLSAATAFLMAANRSMDAAGKLHPVHARNSGLVQAWQRWTESKKGMLHYSELSPLLRSERLQFEENVQVLDNIIRSDPTWQESYRRNPIDKESHYSTTCLITAPLRFWHQPHALIELTPALQQWLIQSDLGDDIPIDLLRPPAPACFIRFGEALQQAIVPPDDTSSYNRIQGVYVFEAVREREKQRALALLPIFDMDAIHKVAMASIDIVINDEQRSLTDHIEELCNRDNFSQGAAHFRSLAQLCAKVFLYWNAVQALRVKETPYTDALLQLERIGPKKAAKVRRQVDKLYDRVLLGPLELPANTYGANGEISPHWRRGHFRMQPHGPQMSLRKVMFIAPTLVRADRLDIQ
jgi:hypothetical protein